MLAISVQLIAVAPATAPPSVAGVHLGMSPAAVLQTIRSRGAKARVFRISCLADYLAEHSKEVPISGPGHCTQTIDTTFGGGSLLVFFSEDLPRHPGASVVTGIALNYPAEATLTAIVSQLGPPSITDHEHPWVVADWCYGFVCNDMNRLVGGGYPGAKEYAGVHRGCCLSVEDRATKTRSDNFIDSTLQAHGVRRVP